MAKDEAEDGGEVVDDGAEARGYGRGWSHSVHAKYF